jgi:hypothetical protein
MEKNTSCWMVSAETPDHPPLTEDITVDVAVVGGGVAGLSVAGGERRARRLAGNAGARIKAQVERVFSADDPVPGQAGIVSDSEGEWATYVDDAVLQGPATKPLRRRPDDE